VPVAVAVAGFLAVLGILVAVLFLLSAPEGANIGGGLIFFIWLAAIAVCVGALVSRHEADRPAGLPPAGWYPDPVGRAGMRFWDGSRWTEHAG
jgi:Protein of unknown function (DUF2510)